MTNRNSLQSLSDDALLQSLSALLSQSRRVEADLVALIAEVDERRLYASQACSSMFVYGVEVLHLSEPEAYLRITVARAARKHPQLLLMLGEGHLHLSGIALLAPHLTEENCDRVLARAAFKTKRQVEELVAELSPKPDVLATIRKLPTAPSRPQPQPEAVIQLRPDGVDSQVQPNLARPAPRPKPLAPERYRVEFTASKELRDKLERLQALTQADLAAVIEAAVTEKLERLEANRYAETKRPRKNVEDVDTTSKSRYIPAPIRRAVRKRDGDQCAFVDGRGRRCTARRGLEFHHHEPFARGGAHDPETLSLRCRTHNLYAAERDYGKKLIDRYRRSSDRVSEPAPLYGLRAQSVAAFLAASSSGRAPLSPFSQI